MAANIHFTPMIGQHSHLHARERHKRPCSLTASLEECMSKLGDLRFSAKSDRELVDMTERTSLPLYRTNVSSSMTSDVTAAARVNHISLHLAQPEAQSHDMAQRPFITCHVLDTVSGKPAANVAVKLKLVSPENVTTSHWMATTNSDGRVPTWSSSTDMNALVEQVKGSLSGDDQMVWSLTFDTESYFGKGQTFWPEVELRFAAKKKEEHYHVPLLLGPWSYTTYRGS